METASYAISEQLRLRELLREQKATLEMLDEGVIVLDDDGRIKVMNGRARSMLGVRRDEDGPEEIRELIFSRDILRAILSGKRLIPRSGGVSLPQGRFPALCAFPDQSGERAGDGC